MYPRENRILQLAAIELRHKTPTGRRWVSHFNPGMPIPQDATRIHGITDAMVKDKPRFADRVDSFLEFVGKKAVLVAHNARFDAGFINAELVRCGKAPLSYARYNCTLLMARRMYPSTSRAPTATLPLLCAKFDVPVKASRLHDAVVDAELLCVVYGKLFVRDAAICRFVES